jgi:glucosamine--fructose-6-phosphate aminotransferase (isomerizing)
MCGVFGYVTNRDEALGPILVEAAQRLTYRGYDSVGAATFRDGAIDLRKDVGKVDAVAERHHLDEMRGSRGITQLRWATFGAPSAVNAQPHLDSDGRMAGAHNGNVVNNVELRAEFAAEGMTVRSENDGESCVHAVERYLRRGEPPLDAIRHAYGDLEGDYAFVIGQADDDKLYAFKKGSGMVVGVGDGFTCVSSDLPSILPLTRRIVRPRDGEIVTLWADRVEVRAVADGELVERPVELVTETMDAAQKGGYPHFMAKEIHEQPQVARELLHLLDASADVVPMLERVRDARNVYLVGCGTSFHAALLGSVYFAQLAGKVAIPVLAPQFIAQYAPAVGPDDVGIFVSQSGETKDVLNALGAAQRRGMTCFGLANVVGSALTRDTVACLPLGCGFEVSVPATKTFSNQALAFLYLAYRLAGLDTAALAGVPDLMQATLEAVAQPVEAFAAELAAHDDLYCLGYGATYPIALEGALKLKEVTYSHCEGMLSTEFKHGPLSAVTEGFPIVFVAGPDDTGLIVSGLNEVKVRGARTITVAQEDARLRANGDVLIALPASGPQVSALLAVIPLQLLAYHTGVLRGFDPDFPRNLSKTLTVD